MVSLAAALRDRWLCGPTMRCARTELSTGAALSSFVVCVRGRACLRRFLVCVLSVLVQLEGLNGSFFRRVYLFKVLPRAN